MAATNYLLVKFSSNKIHPILGRKVEDEKLIMHRDDIANMEGSGWDVVYSKPLPSTVKFKYDERTYYFKTPDEENKFINIPFIINPIECREFFNEIKIQVIKKSDNSFIIDGLAKDYPNFILNLETSLLEIGEDYEIKIFTPREVQEEYTLIQKVGVEDFFDKNGDSITIRVKEYGRISGQLVSNENENKVMVNSVITIDELISIVDYDTQEVSKLESEVLKSNVRVNLTNKAISKYNVEKTRFEFLSIGYSIATIVDSKNPNNSVTIRFDIRSKDKLPRPEFMSIKDISGEVDSTISGVSVLTTDKNDTVKLSNLPEGLTFSDNKISGTLNKEGSTIVTAEATNEFGLVTTAKFNVNVSAKTPIITKVNNLTIKAKENVNLTVTVDPAESVLSVKNQLPVGLSLDGKKITGSVSDGKESTYTVTLLATNKDKKSESSFTIKVDPRDPVITAEETLNGVKGESLMSQSITADPGSSTIKVTGLPSGLTFSGGKINGTPDTAGTTEATITATNKTAISTKKVTINVTEPVIEEEAPLEE